jgi:hypothetical protein
MIRKLLAAGVGGGMLLFATQFAHAACGRAAPTALQRIATGDTAMTNTMCAGSIFTTMSTFARHAQNFGFEDRWNNGWGYFSWCDDTQPAQLTMNALELLRTGMPGATPAATDLSGNLLHHYYNVATNAVTDMSPSCARSDAAAEFFDDLVTISDGLYTRTQLVGHVALYPGFFYDYSVVERAAIVVHEARHQVTKHLTHRSRSGGYCTMRPITTCDLRWGSGAFTYEATWLWWYAVEGDRVTTLMRRQALDAANWIVANAFDERATVVPWCNC